MEQYHSIRICSRKWSVCSERLLGGGSEFFSTSISGNTFTMRNSNAFGATTYRGSCSGSQISGTANSDAGGEHGTFTGSLVSSKPSQSGLTATHSQLQGTRPRQHQAAAPSPTSSQQQSADCSTITGLGGSSGPSNCQPSNGVPPNVQAQINQSKPPAKTQAQSPAPQQQPPQPQRPQIAGSPQSGPNACFLSSFTCAADEVCSEGSTEEEGYQMRCVKLSGDATACLAKAKVYNASEGQNKAFMAAACLDYCLYSETNDARFLKLYEHNQLSANKMCSIGLGNCNEIKRELCR